MPSDKEYYKEYRRAERDFKSGKREDMIDKRYPIEFKGKKNSLAKFKKYYRDKIETDNQQIVFNTCVDLLTMIDAYKLSIELDGLAIKHATGTIKINPLNKELRDTIKSFTTNLAMLEDMLTPDETVKGTDKLKENKFARFIK